MTDIRRMRADELARLVDWARDEGWNPGRNDADCFWSLDPDGFLALVDGAELVGGGAIIRHSDTFGFMGLFIVRPAYRGQKLGTRLWLARRDQLLARLQPGGTIGLDGVDAMVPFYQRGGFEPFTRHRRFEWSPSPPAPAESPAVVDLKSIPPGDLAAYDPRCFPAHRPDYLQTWIHQPGAIARGVVKSGQIVGMGVLRPCVVGWKIGPLWADSGAIATTLLHTFAASADGQPVYLDAPDNNPAAIALCRQFGMQEVFGCTRMYLGPAPDIDHSRIFGITTLEVG